MRILKLLTLPVLLLVAGPVFGQGAPAIKTAPASVEEAEAKKSEVEKKAEQEREEAERQLPDGMRLMEGDVVEVYVDAAGKIYKTRRYQGVVPRLQDEAAFSEAVRAQLKGGKLAKVSWIGFQKLLAASRVFIKTDRVVVYTLYKPTPDQIIVEFPRAMVPLRNSMRELVTHNFDTPVRRVRIDQDVKRELVRVLIDLEPPVSYIYRQDGPYIYVDIER